MQTQQITQFLNGKHTLGLTIEDIENAKKVSQKVKIFKFDKQEIKNREIFNRSIKEVFATINGVIVMFEQEDDVWDKENEDIMQYIYEFVDDEASVVFGVKIVENLPQKPISIFIGGR